MNDDCVFTTGTNGHPWCRVHQSWCQATYDRRQLRKAEQQVEANTLKELVAERDALKAENAQLRARIEGTKIHDLGTIEFINPEQLP